MQVGVFDLFKIGLGPSSSHTTGPMRAAQNFVSALATKHLLPKLSRIGVDLYGSLALTGHGHATDLAILLGLSGFTPDGIMPAEARRQVTTIRSDHKLTINLPNATPPHQKTIPFNEKDDLIFRTKESLPAHPNGMRFSAYDAEGTLLDRQIYFSTGGGFIVTEAEFQRNNRGQMTDASPSTKIPYPFNSGHELLDLVAQTGLSIDQLIRANELVSQSEDSLNAGLDRLWTAMQDCVKNGLTPHEEGETLPGGLGVMRRAPALYRALTERPEAALRDPLTVMDWVNLYAMAVNEENAAGGRVVTAPTNGAAGIIPAVLHYYERFCIGADRAGIHRFLLTATAIGLLYKQNASISGAEVGCQGEVGVACSMAAAGLTAALDGSPRQIENAAEIGMEHNLGLTCDPVAGLVQIPCIERNAMGAIKAINAARLALRGDGTHAVSLDSVIETMRQTGADMDRRYKETSLGGLAVNVVNC
ncbi:MAG: L-serine ammonia-lyase [Alphaproteobacteria bacterium]|nr:L-serine ammonia-lyase [Alphaproteobacteria bacterium]